MTQSDKLMIEFGYLSVAFSTFDYCVNEINSTLINNSNSKIGKTISLVLRLGTHQRIELYKSLIKQIDFPPEILEEADKIISGFKKIVETRNELIHGVWHTNGDEFETEEYYIAKLNSDWNNAKKINLDELRELRKSLHLLTTKQASLNEKISRGYDKILSDELTRKKKALKLLKKYSSNDHDVN